MVQSKCDRCGCSLDRLDRQYVATIDIRPTVGPAETDEDPGDRDHLLEIHEMLEAAEGNGNSEAVEEFEPREFLLCHECCSRFQDDPLPHDAALHLGFSQN